MQQPNDNEQEGWEKKNKENNGMIEEKKKKKHSQCEKRLEDWR